MELWVLVDVGKRCGYPIGFATGWIVSLAVDGAVGEATIAVGAVIGIGLMQWLCLRYVEVFRAGRWVLAHVAGSFAGLALGFVAGVGNGLIYFKKK